MAIRELEIKLALSEENHKILTDIVKRNHMTYEGLVRKLIMREIEIAKFGFNPFQEPVQK